MGSSSWCEEELRCVIFQSQIYEGTLWPVKTTLVPRIPRKMLFSAFFGGGGGGGGADTGKPPGY